MKINLKNSKPIRNIFLTILISSLVFFVCDDFLLPWYVNKDGVVIVPDLIGKDTNTAKMILDSLRFEIIYSGSKSDERYPAGSIINQNPVAGKIVKPKRRIYLILSGGEQQIIVPDLKGKSFRDVKFIIERHNLVLNEVKYIPTEQYPENTVVEQTIEPGTKVRKNTLISLTISRGKFSDSVEVPNLIGKSLKEAEKIIGEYGLKIGQLEFQASMKILPNTVIDQYPRPGDYVSWGDPVNLFITKTGIKRIEKFEY